MIRIKCPACHGIVFLSQFHQPLGRMTCHFCSQSIELADATLADPCWRVDLSSPVSGTWVRLDAAGRVAEIGGSTQSVAWILAVPVLAVAGGFVGLLMWMHVTGRGGWLGAGVLGFAMLATLLLAGYVAMALGGQVIVRLGAGRGTVFTGVGRLGWARRFDWSAIGGLSEQATWRRTPANPHGLCLVLEGEPPILFGAMLNDVRRYYLFAALCKQIDQRNAGMT